MDAATFKSINSVPQLSPSRGRAPMSISVEYKMFLGSPKKERVRVHVGCITKTGKSNQCWTNATGQSRTDSCATFMLHQCEPGIILICFVLHFFGCCRLNYWDVCIAGKVKLSLLFLNMHLEQCCIQCKKQCLGNWQQHPSIQVCIAMETVK